MAMAGDHAPRSRCAPVLSVSEALPPVCQQAPDSSSRVPEPTVAMRQNASGLSLRGAACMCVTVPRQAWPCSTKRLSQLCRSVCTKLSRRVQAARAQGPEKAVTGHAPSSACAPGPYAHLPGDPGVILYTNVTMGDKKMAFMKAVSQAVASCLGKPESYVGVCVQVRHAAAVKL